MTTVKTPTLDAGVTIKKLATNRTLLSFIALFAFWGVAVLVAPSFGTGATTAYLVQTASFLGIVALGQNLVIVMGGIDLSVSGVVALSAVVCAQVSSTQGPVMGILIAVGASGVVGLVNATGVSFLGMPPIVMTLATETILTGVLLIYTNGSPMSANVPVLRAIANDAVFGIPLALGVWALFIVLALWLLHASGMGRFAFSLGNNVRASRASGVPVAKTNIVMYVGCSVLAGCAGLILLGFTSTSSLTMGEPYQLLSIAAVVLGGTSILGGRGHLLGTVSGALLLTLLTALLSAWDISEAWRQIALGLLIIALLLVYSREARS